MSAARDRFTVKRVVVYQVCDTKRNVILPEQHREKRDAEHVVKGLNWKNQVTK